MTKHVLFLQGAGEGAYAEDQKLATSLRRSLGSEYEVHYPAIPDEGNVPYEQWRQFIEKQLAAIPEPVILVGHSVGASVAIKYLSERQPPKSIAGVFLMACPFWGGDGWRYDGWESLALPPKGTSKLPEDIPIVMYHCRDDEVVQFEHLAMYAKALPQAQVHELDEGGHQLNNDLSFVAKDIKSLSQDSQ